MGEEFSFEIIYTSTFYFLFIGLAYSAIDDYLRSSVNESQQHEIRQLRDEILQIRKDNSRIKRQEELTKSSLEDSAATEAHLKASLQKAFTDVVSNRDEIFSSTGKRPASYCHGVVSVVRLSVYLWVRP